jgi:hypothetical protein
MVYRRGLYTICTDAKPEQALQPSFTRNVQVPVAGRGSEESASPMPVVCMSEWSCREAAGGIPESAREPSLIYPAGRASTPADPNIPPGRDRVELVWSEGRARARCKVVTRARPAGASRWSMSPKAGGHTGAQSRSTASGESCQRFGVGYGQRSVGPSVHRHVLVKGQGFRHMPGHQLMPPSYSVYHPVGAAHRALCGAQQRNRVRRSANSQII